MTGLLAERDRRRRYSITRAIGKENIPRPIWPGTPASCRLTLMMAMGNSICQGERPGPSWRRRVGYMPGAHSSPWPISRKTPGAKRRARRRSRCHRSRSRSYAVSMRSSRSSDRSTGKARTTVWRFAGTKAGPLVEELELYLRAQLDRLSRGHDLAKAMQLHSQTTRCLQAVPRGWPCMPVEQCRRARAAQCGSWQKSLAVLRV